MKRFAMRLMVLVAALVAPSLLAACNFEPSARDPWSARHGLDTIHESRSAADARLSSPHADARSSRRDAHAR
jgi:hypothetical protein